jgi:hypothetical protein
VQVIAEIIPVAQLHTKGNWLGSMSDDTEIIGRDRLSSDRGRLGRLHRRLKLAFAADTWPCCKLLEYSLPEGLSSGHISAMFGEPASFQTEGIKGGE